MPEGPEIFCSTDYIRDNFVGEKLASFVIHPSSRYGKKLPAGYEDFARKILLGRIQLHTVLCRGKLQTLVFSMFSTFNQPHLDYYEFVAISAGMTGFWATHPQNKHIAWQLNFQSGKILFFEDQRHFASIKFGNAKQSDKRYEKIGPCFIFKKFPNQMNDYYEKLLKIELLKNNQTLCQFLMRQDLISGVGNYVKAESLYRAKLSPHRVSSSLSDEEIKALYDALVYVLNRSYQLGGASLRDYHQVDGRRGNFADEFQVYGKKKDPLGNDVIRDKTADKRTTWWVPVVQR